MLQQRLLSRARDVLPWLFWPRAFQRDTLHADLQAGLISGLIALPQAIAMAALLGMPLEMGIYASVFPAAIATLWGSSWHTISGPNTEITLLLLATVAPLAVFGSAESLQFLLLLTLMVGVLQLLFGVLRLSPALNFISDTVVVAVTHAVALMLIVSASTAILGISTDGMGFVRKIYETVRHADEANIYSIIIGFGTIAAGLLTRRWKPRFALLSAMCAAILIYFSLLRFTDMPVGRITLIGEFPLTPLPFSFPDAAVLTAANWRELLYGALAIAFIGLMQTTVIARSIARKTGQQLDFQQEIIGQGLANTVAPFLSSFAGAGSFSRSAGHLEAGARTPAAALYTIVILITVAFAGQFLLAQMPTVAISAIFFLVGFGLINTRVLKRAISSRAETVILLLTLITSLTISLNMGITTGLLLSLSIYLKNTSDPNVEVRRYIGRHGGTVAAVDVVGNLFFGSTPAVKLRLPQPRQPGKGHDILLLKTQHISYIDIPGAELIIEELRNWRERGDAAYVYVTQPLVLKMLIKAGVNQLLDDDCIILRDRSHPMKHILHPYSKHSDQRRPGDLRNRDADHEVRSLASEMLANPLMGPVSERQVISLLSNVLEGETSAGPAMLSAFHQLPPESARQALARMKTTRYRSGDTIIKQGESVQRYCLIQEGIIKVIRENTLADQTKTLGRLGVGDAFGEQALLTDSMSDLTFRMHSDGSLLEMSRQDFETLIVPNLLQQISPAQLEASRDLRDIAILDCRYDLEFRAGHIPGALHIPLHQLRFRLDRLDSSRTWVIYSGDGKRSAAAAFLLRERRLDAYSLSGGFKQWQQYMLTERGLSAARWLPRLLDA